MTAIWFLIIVATSPYEGGTSIEKVKMVSREQCVEQAKFINSGPLSLQSKGPVPFLLTKAACVQGAG